MTRQPGRLGTPCPTNDRRGGDFGRSGTACPTYLVLALVFAQAAQAAPTGLLNDTGQTSCYDAADTAVACDVAGVGGDAGVNPRQDARFGRDAKNAAGTLSKIGGGAAGFDFTKICWNGDAEGSGTCTGTLVANTSATASGTASTDWACTKDNVTNLVWSLETISGVDWFAATDSGAGSSSKAYNDASRCGFATGWRVPTRRELLSIVHYGATSPAIDGNYFPATQSNAYWSSDSCAGFLADAWVVFFNGGGGVAGYDRAGQYFVRLVRSGP